MTKPIYFLLSLFLVGSFIRVDSRFLQVLYRDWLPSAYAQDEDNEAASDLQYDLLSLKQQMRALDRMRSLLNKKHGKKEESEFLLDTAGLMDNALLILKRILSKVPEAEIPTYQSKRTTLLNEQIRVLTRILTQYGNLKGADKALFKRGSAYRELGRNDESVKDLHDYTQKYPRGEYAIYSAITVSEIYLDKEKYQQAFQVLSVVRPTAKDATYPVVMKRLGQAKFGMGQPVESIQYSRRQIAYYKYKKRTNSPDIRSAEQDLALYYATAIEKKNPEYTSQSALGFFRKIENGPALTSLLLQFTTFLRSKNLEKDLDIFKVTVVQSDLTTKDKILVSLAVLEDQANKQRYSSLYYTGQELYRTLYSERVNEDKELQEKVKNSLSRTIDRLQMIVRKAIKGQKDLPLLQRLVLLFYTSLSVTLAKTDPMYPMVLFGIAEAYFELKDFAKAKDYYLRVVQHADAHPDIPPTKPEIIPLSKMKLVATQYENFRSKKIIPENLQPKALPPEDMPVAADLTRWIQLVDAFYQGSPKEMETFVFEANRALYINGAPHQALERLEAFYTENPQSKFAIPSAMLILDTYVASKKWAQTHEKSDAILTDNQIQDPSFRKKVSELAESSYYKLIEQDLNRKAYPDTIAKVDDFLRKYPHSKLTPGVLAMGAKAAQAQGDNQKSLNYLNNVAQSQNANPDQAKAAGLQKANLLEEQGDRNAATQEYKNYLENPPKNNPLTPPQMNGLAKQTLQNSYASGDQAMMNSALASKGVCRFAGAIECDKFFGLALLGGAAALTANHLSSANSKAKANRSDRIVWMTLALKQPDKLSFADRSHYLQAIAEDYPKQEAQVQFALIPHLSTGVPDTFRSFRETIRKQHPIKLDEAAIQQRVKALNQVEAVAAHALKLPWQRIHAEVLSQVALTSLDIASELTHLPIPSGASATETQKLKETMSTLAKPFHDKAITTGQRAFEIASNSAIEPDSFRKVWGSFQTIRGAEATRALKPDFEFASAFPLSETTISKLQPPVAGSNKGRTFRAKWLSALQRKNLAEISGYYQDSFRFKELPEEFLKTARAVSLSVAGAQAEGLSGLRELIPGFTAKQQVAYLAVLFQFYLNSYSKTKIKEIAETIFQSMHELSDGTDLSDAALSDLANGAHWAGTELPDKIKKHQTQGEL